MKWNRWILVLGFFLVVGFTLNARAELYSDPWAGTYNTGGYNLLGFANNLSNTSSYLNSMYGPYYGGGCSSFLSPCSSPYDSYGLYGNNWGLGNSYGYNSGYGLSFDIDISLLFSSLNSYGNYGYGNSGCGSWGGYGCGYSSYYPTCGTSMYPSYSSCDIGCSIGYCNSNSYYPYQGNSLYGYNPYSNNYGSSWHNYYPYTPLNLTVNLDFSYQNVPTWGNCGGIIPCTTPTVVPPTITPYQPQYQPVNQYAPTAPVRYQVPRAATH